MPIAAPPSTRAFTLIELLVVISIIAVLAGMVLGALGPIRESVRSTTCKSNLRQIGMAVITYAGDNEGFLPYEGTKYGTYKVRLADFGLYSATGSSVSRCPTANVLHPTDFTYGHNFYRYHIVGQPIDREQQLNAKPISTVFYMVDSWWFETGGYYYFNLTPDNPSWSTHRGLNNALYLDGHAEAQPWTALRFE